MAVDLIQEAKGYEGPSGGPVTDHLDAAETHIDRVLTAFQQENSECPSCGGLNTSCPDGCGRDPITGELNFSRLENSDGR